MDRLFSMLGKKLGPLAAWQWGVIGGGVIIAYVYIRQRRAGTPVPVPAGASASDGGVDSGAGAGTGDRAGGAVENTIAITTNTAWIRYVTDHLVAKGEDPVAVNNALTKGLGGIPLSAQERALWNLAVKSYGAPPEGSPPIDAPNPPPPTPVPVPVPTPKPVPIPIPIDNGPGNHSPVPAPPKGHYETVVRWTRTNPPWNSTISGMAAHFHIANWHTVWDHPANAHIKQLRGVPERIQPGDRIFIPGV